MSIPSDLYHDPQTSVTFIYYSHEGVYVEVWSRGVADRLSATEKDRRGVEITASAAARNEERWRTYLLWQRTLGEGYLI